MNVIPLKSHRQKKLQPLNKDLDANKHFHRMLKPKYQKIIFHHSKSPLNIQEAYTPESRDPLPRLGSRNPNQTLYGPNKSWALRSIADFGYHEIQPTLKITQLAP